MRRTLGRPKLPQSCAGGILGQSQIAESSLPRQALATRLRFQQKAFTGSSSALPRRAAVSASSEQVQSLTSGRPERKDPFRAAAYRLNSLLSGVGDGTEELADKLLEDESSEVKVLLACLASSLLTGAAAIVCWLLHEDLFGGATVSLLSLRHAALGFAAALLPAALKLAGWRSEAHRALPLLAGIHEKDAQRMQPLMAGMTREQVAVMSFAEIVPTVFLLFPAMHGGLQLVLQLYSNRLMELGWGLPQGDAFLIALAVLAAFAGATRGLEHAPSEEAFEIIGDAVSNADRYYKLVGPSVAQRQDEAEQMSSAFKLTAAAWFEHQTASGTVSAALAVAEVLFLGGLWYWTHDLSTPMAAALLVLGADFAGMYGQLDRSRKEKR